MPYISVSVPQDFVQYVAELPAEDGAAGQREAQSVGPEGVGSLLPVSPQDDSCCCVVKEAQTITGLLAERMARFPRKRPINVRVVFLSLYIYISNYFILNSYPIVYT